MDSNDVLHAPPEPCGCTNEDAVRCLANRIQMTTRYEDEYGQSHHSTCQCKCHAGSGP